VLRPPSLSSLSVAASSLSLGIDLASQARNTGLCVIEWGRNSGCVLALCRGNLGCGPLTDRVLADAMHGSLPELGDQAPAKIGIDAPFGWPEPFVEAVWGHHRGQAWPGRLDEPRAGYERRETDRAVWERTKKTPLSVSTDKIAFPAMRCATLLAAFRRAHGVKAADKAGRGVVIEAYPDPSLRHWTRKAGPGLGPRESYKGPERVERRRQLTKLIASRARLVDPNRLLDLCATHDDCLDALICALVARAAELGRTVRPSTRKQERLARREGWIHLPDCSLGELAS
jgi:uncharacterized protein DUF429